MREETTAEKVSELIRALGRAARSGGAVYLSGGTSAVLIGWRDTTVDADLKFDPEPAGVFEAIPKIKEALDMNIELAAPEDFIPAPPGWRERSQLIQREGPVSFYHYDFYAQALSKIERGHERDLADVRAMLDRSLIEPEALRARFAEIEPLLSRYPAIDPGAFREKLEEFLEGVGGPA